MGAWFVRLQRLLLWFGKLSRFVQVYVLGKHLRLHRARFAGIDELGTLVSSHPAPESLLLGMRKYAPRYFFHVQSTVERRELGNLLIVGPTRSGKGLLATSQLLSWQHSVVVNDIKGELFFQTAGYRSTLGPVYVIDPAGVGHCFDPLQGKETEDALFSAASHLLFEPEERERIFTQRATVMLTQLFLAAIYEGHPSLPYVRQLVRSGLPQASARLHALSPELATQFLDVSFAEVNFQDRFLTSTWSTLTARLRPLLTETLVRCFTQSDFTAQDLLCGSRPVTVYFRWKEADLLHLSPLVRLLWGTLINDLISTYDSVAGQNCQPVLLLVDEAGRTAIPSLADFSTTVVGRGITLWIAIQSLSQLEMIYGKARAQVLRDNMESQVFYRPTDLATAAYLEHRLGEVSAFAQSQTARGGTAMSEGRSERPVPLLTAQEIMQLKDEEIIAFHRRLPPFRLNRVDWREQPLLSGRHGLVQPALLPLPAVAPIPEIGTDTAAQFPYGFVDPDYRN